MSNFTLLHASCADQNVDAVVNAAHPQLWKGSGICGLIFIKCGVTELTQACSDIPTPLKDGEAVITPAFNMKNAKNIIHAVGPNFGRTPNAFTELFNAYFNSLMLLKKNNLHSISFPMISSGAHRGTLTNPAAESTKQCVLAYQKFLQDFPEYDIDVKLCAFSSNEYQAAVSEVQELQARK